MHWRSGSIALAANYARCSTVNCVPMQKLLAYLSIMNLRLKDGVRPVSGAAFAVGGGCKVFLSPSRREMLVYVCGVQIAPHILARISSIQAITSRSPIYAPSVLPLNGCYRLCHP